MRLVFYPDPVLLRPADRVLEVTEEVRSKAQEMVPYMVLEKGIGLAAPQVGWGVRVLVASETGDPKLAKVLVNPEIVDKGGGTEWGEEGCLSFPGIYGEVSRWKSIKVRALSLENEVIELEAADLFARVLQHEIDHLDGVLFVTKMRPADKAMNKQKLMELVRKHAERKPAAERFP